MSMLVEVLTRRQHGKVGLRLGEVVKPDGALAADDRAVPDRTEQKIVQAAHRCRVRASDGWHVDDHPLHELHTCTRCQEPDLRHAVVLLDRNAMWTREVFHCDAHATPRTVSVYRDSEAV